jgi:hypothetical protein
VLIVFQILALVIAAVLSVGIGRAGWIKTFTPIVQLAGSGVVWAKDIPAWSVRVIGTLELLAGMVILAAPIVMFIQGPSRLIASLGVAASVGVAALMAAAYLFHRMRGEATHTWKTNLAFGALAVMAAATMFITGWA